MQINQKNTNLTPLMMIIWITLLVMGAMEHTVVNTVHSIDHQLTTALNPNQ